MESHSLHGDNLSNEIGEDVMAEILGMNLDRREDFLDYLSLQNSLLGESCPVLAACLGCSVNCQPLVSTESAMAAIFYIIDYVTKDSFKPTELLSFVMAARTRLTTYSGNAPPGEDPASNDRPARRLMQIVQNGIAGVVEIGSQLNNVRKTLPIYRLISAVSSLRV